MKNSDNFIAYKPKKKYFWDCENKYVYVYYNETTKLLLRVSVKDLLLSPIIIFLSEVGIQSVCKTIRFEEIFNIATAFRY